ncbi:MAG: MerR family transcriptional regulator [Oscillospiraceae bacterium]|nr:MerR family transcriptional regulator [Oscillospiraceae bacterium]
MEYSIGAFSGKTGLSIHTLRFYEKEGLLHPIRGGNGRRVYTEEDLSWATFIVRLKESEMPIRDIQKYARLCAEGSATLAARREILRQHRALLSTRVETLRAHLHKLDEEIAVYDTELAR